MYLDEKMPLFRAIKEDTDQNCENTEHLGTDCLGGMWWRRTVASYTLMMGGEDRRDWTVVRVLYSYYSTLRLHDSWEDCGGAGDGAWGMGTLGGRIVGETAVVSSHTYSTIVQGKFVVSQHSRAMEREHEGSYADKAFCFKCFWTSGSRGSILRGWSIGNMGKISTGGPGIEGGPCARTNNVLRTT